MENLLFYFLKVILCSGVLFLYYIIFLKDKTFHHYNRFYLLVTLFLSIILPLVKVQYFTIEVNPDLFLLLKNFKTVQSQTPIQNDFNIYSIIFLVFSLVSFFFLMKFLVGLIKIQILKTRFPKTELEGIKFYETSLEEAPFSFFRNLFWKNSIELESDLGRQILKHEMVHIEQKHTWDKIIITIVNSLFWFNPVFYFIKKEIFLIHEYLADKKTVKHSDTKAFAQMLLQSHFTGTSLPATSPFLSSNLKKRLIMLKKSHTKFSYLRKISALPVIFFLAFAYMVNAKNREIKDANLVIANAVFELKNDTIRIKNDTVETKITVQLDLNSKVSFEDRIKKAGSNDLFTIDEKKVSKEDYVKYYQLNKSNDKIGFFVDDKIQNKISTTVFSAIKFPNKDVAFGRVYDEKLDGKILPKKIETYDTSVTYFDKNRQKKDVRSKYTYAVASSFSEDLSENPISKSLKDSKDSDVFLIDNKKVSKSEYTDFINKNIGKKGYSYSITNVDDRNSGRLFSAFNVDSAKNNNKVFVGTIIENSHRKFKEEAEKVKKENQDLTKIVAVEKPNSTANPNQNNPWILNVKAYPKTILENPNIKYYLNGRLIDESILKTVIPNEIKSINVVKDPKNKNVSRIYIISKDSPLEITPTQFDKIIINGKAAIQSDLNKLNRDSIKTENIKKNTKNGKSYNEIRIRTK